MTWQWREEGDETMMTQTQELTSYAPVLGNTAFGHSQYSPAAIKVWGPSAVSVEAVRELIDAAGPLTIRDIAGGLDVAAHEASAVVGRMMLEGCLSRDEWDRHRLSGLCRN
jgi:hypothetical protein